MDKYKELTRRSSLKNVLQGVKPDSLNCPASLVDESLLIIGEDIFRGKAVILELPFGKGKIVLFGFNVQNRVQACSTFKLLLNGLLNSGKFQV